MRQSLVQCFLCGLMSSVLCQCSCVLLSNVRTSSHCMTDIISHVLSLYSCTVLVIMYSLWLFSTHMASDFAIYLIHMWESLDTRLATMRVILLGLGTIKASIPILTASLLHFHAVLITCSNVFIPRSYFKQVPDNFAGLSIDHIFFVHKKFKLCCLVQPEGGWKLKFLETLFVLLHCICVHFASAYYL